MAVEPLDILIKGLKTVWDANTATLSGINGPYRDEHPPDLTKTFPYCVVRSRDSDDAGWTCHNRYYDHEIEFSVYDRTPELVATRLTTILGVFDPDVTTITLSTGVVVRWRLARPGYTIQDKTVWRGVLMFEFLTSVPRPV